MVDFFEEVEEDLRAERLRRLSRYAPWAAAVVGVVFAGALGFAGWKYYADTSISQASIAYDKGVKAVESGDKAAAERAFVEAQKPFAPGYKALALMQIAGIQGAQGRGVDAVKSLDAAAKAAGGNQTLADLASLQAAYRLIDTAPYPELETRLTPLSKPGRPFNAAAMEALAMAQVKAGKVKDAINNLKALQLLLGVTPDMQQRTSIMLQTLQAGDAPRAIEISKAAAALPPPATPSPTTPQAGSPVGKAGAAPQ